MARAKVKTDLDKIVEALGGHSTGKGYQCCCPAHDDSDPSLALWENDRGQIGLKCYAGCTYKEVQAALIEKGLWPERLKVSATDEGPSYEDYVGQVHNLDSFKMNKAHDKWEKSLPIKGTVGEKYLKARGIVKWPENSVRFLKYALKDKNGEWVSGVVYRAVMDDLTTSAVQVVYVGPDGRKAKDVKTVKQTFGVTQATGVLLPGTGPVVICEGVEDGLSIWQTTGRQVVALFGIEFLQHLPIKAGTEVVFARDPDAPGSAADKRLKSTIDELLRRKVLVRLASPPYSAKEKLDWNELLQRGDLELIKSLIDEAPVVGGQESKKEDVGSGDDLGDTQGDSDGTVPPGGGGTGGAILLPSDALPICNDKHFVVNEKGKTVVYTEALDPKTGKINLHVSSFQDIRNLYLNRQVVIGQNNRSPVFKSLGEWWLEHPERRQYDGIDFAPNVDLGDRYYNMWRGFSYTPKRGSWSRMEEHIFEIICRGVQEHFDYTMGWLAYGVQHPELPAEVALVVKGKKGTGKGTLAKAYGQLFGPHSLYVSQAKHVFGQFNIHLRDTVFLFLDEAFWAGDKQNESALQTLITEPQIMVEAKGMPAYQTQNRVSVMMASNHDWVVPSGFEERRFSVFEASEKRMQDLGYFEKLWDQMDDGGYEAMLHDLLEYDLSNYSPRKIPRTEALLEQKIESMELHVKWWMTRLASGQPTVLRENWGSTPIPAQELYEDYIRYTNVVQSRRRLTDIELFMRVRKLWPNQEFKRIRRTTEVFEREGGKVTSSHKKVWCYILEDLETCRKHFQEQLQQPIKWDELDALVDKDEEIPF